MSDCLRGLDSGKRPPRGLTRRLHAAAYIFDDPRIRREIANRRQGSSLAVAGAFVLGEQRAAEGSLEEASRGVVGKTRLSVADLNADL